LILSFHPIFEADRNRLCAGRSPTEQDREAIKRAHAVILPQGCSEELYEMARKHCLLIFPNYDARFAYPGKIGQIKLFRRTQTDHPATRIFNRLEDLHNYQKNLFIKKLPFVFKFDWGGEGTNVYFVETKNQYQYMMRMAADYEQTGQKGFLFQEYIPTQQKSLRVVVIGEKMISYWRRQPKRDRFGTTISQGAVIDKDSDPELQDAARTATQSFCLKTGINLAGIDILFSAAGNECKPLFLEINYFFGRRGLGGSEMYYQLLIDQIKRWIENQGLA
jgi:ribosomal protein S6--L-glutamate ligase